MTNRAALLHLASSLALVALCLGFLVGLCEGTSWVVDYLLGDGLD